MIALAGVLFLIFLLVIGSELVISAAVGLIACKKRIKGMGRKADSYLKIFLWIFLSVGIVAIAIPLMYFYLIITNW